MTEEQQAVIDAAEKRVQDLFAKASDKDGDIFEAINVLHQKAVTCDAPRNYQTAVSGLRRMLEMAQSVILVGDDVREKRLGRMAAERQSAEDEALKQKLFDDYKAKQKKKSK